MKGGVHVLFSHFMAQKSNVPTSRFQPKGTSAQMILSQTSFPDKSPTEPASSQSKQLCTTKNIIRQDSKRERSRDLQHRVREREKWDLSLFPFSRIKTMPFVYRQSNGATPLFLSHTRTPQTAGDGALWSRQHQHTKEQNSPSACKLQERHVTRMM